MSFRTAANRSLTSRSSLAAPTGALPTAAEVLLVVEVSDSSLHYDRTVKLPLYAAAGIPEAWSFDLTGDRIERHADPGPYGYRQISLTWRGESLASTVLPAVTLAIDEVLPSAQGAE